MLGKLNFKGTVSRDFFFAKKTFLNFVYSPPRSRVFIKIFIQYYGVICSKPHCGEAFRAEKRTQDGRVFGQKRI